MSSKLVRRRTPAVERGNAQTLPTGRAGGTKESSQTRNQILTRGPTPSPPKALKKLNQHKHQHAPCCLFVCTTYQLEAERSKLFYPSINLSNVSSFFFPPFWVNHHRIYDKVWWILVRTCVLLL